MTTVTGKIRVDSIPQKMREREQWMGWKEIPRPGRGRGLTKPPINPRTGEFGSSTDGRMWGSFGLAMEAWERFGLEGIGFALTSNTGIVAIDLDKCRDPETGALDAMATRIVERFDTYTEVSPSGRGLHIFALGKLPAGANRIDGIEMYESGRYMTVTGQVVEKVTAVSGESKSLSPQLEERQAEIDALHAWIDGDAAIVRHARADPRFAALWEGDISAYDNDDSRADLALCNMLAPRCARDRNRIDRIFRWSGLIRDKWDEVHGPCTYGEGTIKKALDSSGTPAVKIGETSSWDPKYTDLKNARRLVTCHGDNIRYHAGRKQWLIWDGVRWQPDNTGAVMRLAKETVDAMHQEALAMHDEKFARSIQSAHKMKMMVEVACTEPGIPVTADDLDSDLYLLNCANGTLDLCTGELRPHRREDLLTRLSAVAFDPEATCPTFERFVERIMDGNDDLITYLQRCLGYSLTGDVTEKAMFILVGGGDNGKTTLIEAVRHVMGDYAGQIPIESLLKKQSDGIPNDIAQLKGLRFVSASEAEAGHSLAESKLKMMTGMGTLQARFLYGEHFTFVPTFKIFMDTNHRPQVHGRDNAIWNRLRIIPFNVSIPPEEKDKHLIDKLKAEGPGILTWLVRGCLEWQQNRGLVEPDAVNSAVAAYREEMDKVKQFIGDCCEQGAGFQVTTQDLYEEYLLWSGENDEISESKKAFGLRLQGLGLTRCKLGGQRGWRGIGLRPVGEEEEAA